MKVAFNKDKLLKHKFWILLIVAVPLVLAGQFIMLVLVAAEINGDKKKLLDLVKEAQGSSGPVFSDANAKARLAEAEKLQKQENAVWAELFKRQAGTMFWPAPIEAYPINDGKFLRELKFVDGAAAPVPDDEHHLTGTILDVTDKYVEVQLKDSDKTEKLYRVATEDMKIDGGIGFFNLPKGKVAQFTFQTGWYFNDKLTQTQWTEYERGYAAQIRAILDIVDPINEDGEGVVTLKDWLVPKNKSDLPPQGVRFLRFVQPWKIEDDVSEEAWLAQEDLWIGKEMYHCVRAANDDVGVMTGKGAAMNQVATFKNPYFEASLKLVNAKRVEVTIKNMLSRRQKLEVTFKVRFTEDKSVPDEPVKIEHEPLGPQGGADDTRTVTRDLPAGPARTGVYRVEQMLNWETAAVRRIDAISIGSMSPEDIAMNHRSYPDNVKPLVPKKEEPAAVVDPAAPVVAPPPGPGPGGVRPGAGPMAFRGPGFGGVAPVLADVTVNGLIKDRYIEPPTEQTRRLPVAIALIVDQDHIDRVLTAFSNSRHRFVLTQLLVNRYPQTVRPDLNGGSALNPQPVGPQFPGRGPGIPMRPGFGPGLVRPGAGPGFMRPGAGPGFGGQFGGPLALPGGQTGDEEIEANVELVLYGTVTLYQRYPARMLPKTEAVEEKKQP